MEDLDIVEGCKVLAVAPSLVVAVAAAVVAAIEKVLAWAMMIRSSVELAVDRFLVGRRKDRRDRDWDIYAVFLVVGEHFAEAMVVIVTVNLVLAWGLVEHLGAAAVELRLEHSAYLEAALALGDLVGVVHIFEAAESASFPGNEHKDPSVVGWDRADALDVASHGEVHVAGLLGVDGIFVDVDAWADDDLEYVVAGVEVHAWGGHASVDAHTSDVADDDVEAAVTVHLYRLALDDAYDAGRAEKLEVVGPNWGHGDSQASFHLGVQLHCFR